MALSSGLTLADLSDYLAPSQICIKPVNMVEDTTEEPPTSIGAKTSNRAAAATDIFIDRENGYYEVDSSGSMSNGKKLKKAEITLNDCLACSGCITSAESVLVSMQSHEEVYRVLEEQPSLTPILSISPQSLASLAAYYEMSLSDTLMGLRLFFKRELGFRLVFDTTFSRSLSLEENKREFLERRAHARTSAPPNPESLSKSSLNPASSSTGPLPILSSACPGWICYAEKTHGELLPFVSNVKSPQAIMGTLVKYGDIATRLELRPDQIFHVTVMPCYDKKLEASRPDFASPLPSSSSSTSTIGLPVNSIDVRDVDCVLTTGEVQKMLSDAGLSLKSLANSATQTGGKGLTVDVQGEEEDSFFPSLLPQPTGTSSGGYVHNAIKAVLNALPLKDLINVTVEEHKVRSEDYIEYNLKLRGVVILRAAKCYGFRNLQNVVRKLGRDHGVTVARGAAGKSNLPVNKGFGTAAAIARERRAAAMRKRNTLSGVEAGGTSSGASTPGTGMTTPEDRELADKPVEYIEVMACPSGCVNGGGQIAPPKESRGSLRRKWKLDEEGMPDVAEGIEAGDSLNEDESFANAAENEVKMVVRLEEDERVLSAKEWVAQVEKAYWSGSVSVDGYQGHNIAANVNMFHESIVPFLEGNDSERLQSLTSLQMEIIRALLDRHEGEEDVEAREARRKQLFRTTYRAVQSEEINGLAVKW